MNLLAHCNQQHPSLAVVAKDKYYIDLAKRLAKQLNLPYTETDDDNSDFLLIVGHQLELLSVKEKLGQALFIDFLAGKSHHRRQFGGGRGQLIARACGMKKSTKKTLIDATAGLGADAFALACLGCEVLMIERSPIIAELLNDALQRFYANSELSAGIKLQLETADAIHYLKNCKRPDVIYLDPMYPERRKSAINSKEMRILRYFVGDDGDFLQLLEIARNVAKQRVVVKRPRLAPSIGAPDIVYNGKAARFDVFLCSL